MSYQKATPEFFAVVKATVRVIYSAKHLGRVEGWLSRNPEKITEKALGGEVEILNRETYLNRCLEEVEIEFLCPHDSKIKKTSIARRDIGSCLDPRTNRYWSM